MHPDYHRRAFRRNRATAAGGSSRHPGEGRALYSSRRALVICTPGGDRRAHRAVPDGEASVHLRELRRLQPVRKRRATDARAGPAAAGRRCGALPVRRAGLHPVKRHRGAARPDRSLLRRGRARQRSGDQRREQANYTAFWSLLERRDRVAFMLPNYLQAWGLARAFGSAADAFRLVPRREGNTTRWAPDAGALRRAGGRKTRRILGTNPNNPTGADPTAGE